MNRPRESASRIPMVLRSWISDWSSDSAGSTYVVPSRSPSWTALRKTLPTTAGTSPLSSVNTMRAARAWSAKGDPSRTIAAKMRIATAEASAVPSATRASNHSRTVARPCLVCSRMCPTLPARNSAASTEGWTQSVGRPG
ncbi:hypothetical protein GA0115253_1075327 [Streptomyces sp. Termitarium-T10T-6]|nr:hypothetical protein GA0115253_1075327 [Streptomyces sp. Termitarium-T10T-6]